MTTFLAVMVGVLSAGWLATLLVLAPWLRREVEARRRAELFRARVEVRTEQSQATTEEFERARQPIVQPEPPSEAVTVVMHTGDADAVTEVLELPADRDPVVVADQFPAGAGYLAEDGPTPLYDRAVERLPDVAALLDRLADEPEEDATPLYAVDPVPAPEPQPADGPGGGQEDADEDDDPPAPPPAPEPQPALAIADSAAVRRYALPESAPLVGPVPGVPASERLAKPGWQKLLRRAQADVRRRVRQAVGGRHRRPNLIARLREEIPAWWDGVRGDTSETWDPAYLRSLAGAGGAR